MVSSLNLQSQSITAHSTDKVYHLNLCVRIFSSFYYISDESIYFVPKHIWWFLKCLKDVDLWVGHHGDELALHLDEHVASLEAGLVGGRVDPQHLLHLEGSGSS